MSKEIINTGLLAVLFLLLFAIAEFLYHKLKVKADLTRKIVHFGSGVLTLLFPIMLGNHWLVLILCAGFAIILIVSLKFHFLKSINLIDRISYGSILYPFAVYSCYLAYDHFDRELLFFYLPILILAVCDPMAALIGKSFPYGKFNMGKDTKTISGSFSFFITAIVVTLILFHFISSKYFRDILPVTLLIAGISSVTEAISIKGLDNITIPASVLLVLIIFR